MRALSLYLPFWPTDLARRRRRRSGASAPRERHRPGGIVLVDTVGQCQFVAHGCGRAAAAGIRPGMTLAHARALLPADIHVAPHAPERDREALGALAVWAVQFCPRVAPDPPDGLLADFTGCAHLYGGEPAFLDLLIREAARLGLHAQAAIAPTYGCAWGIARFGQKRSATVLDREHRQAMAPLPPAALRIGADATNALAEVGITSIGNLYDLPRSAIPARFGPELLRRLDQALGQATERIEPVTLPPPLQVERLFDGPASSLEGVMLAARGLIERLGVLLAQRRRGARALRLTLARSDAPPLHLDIRLSSPSRAVAHLWSLLRPHVERANLGFGVESLTLSAISTGRLRDRQAAWGDDQPAGEGRDTAEFIDTLVNRCGPDRVVRIEPVASHLPERTSLLRPIVESHAPREAVLSPSDRPSVLLDHPEPAEVMAMTPDSPPSWLRWRDRDRPIARGIGPERLGCEWWRKPGSARDYFKVQGPDGLWLWVYRDLQSGRWFVHGLWA